MNVQVEVKTNYGKEAIYPMNATAGFFAKLLNQKTLTRRDLDIIKELGFTLEVTTPSL